MYVDKTHRSNTQPRTTCWLLDLPAELRLKIYDFTLAGHKQHKPYRRLFATLGLLLANQQIHSEALCIFYNGTTFIVDEGLADCYRWFTKMPAANLRAICELIMWLTWPCDDDFKAEFLAWDFISRDVEGGIELKKDIIWMTMLDGGGVSWFNVFGSRKKEKTNQMLLGPRESAASGVDG